MLRFSCFGLFLYFNCIGCFVVLLCCTLRNEGVWLSVSAVDCKLRECDVIADPDHFYEVYNQSLQTIGVKIYLWY